ncbi:phospholipid scramblase 1-like [Mytilus californianus]|uniref:phospholipid scramblase 1-like n=1 Tax=Mytilus californianus TaxID=6549 RepID=UPI002245E2EA|nr:phospholipid scramblase 1-like [Mytilus californianus]XP_052081946.1 phospholipid scramblase 1-like [Mytilus californianus]XP_052081947.1 phospholipid scramblase 1-like [Mytilus californianus]
MQMTDVILTQPGQDKRGFPDSGVAPPPGCPPGLEYLAQMDEIYVNQKVDLLEMITDSAIEIPNRYSIENHSGQRAYFAQEESECCNRMCCGPDRGFIMHITTNDGREVIRCERKFKWCAGCCWCADSETCGWEMTVEAPVGTVIGYIRQHSSKWKTHLTLYDANRQKLYDIWSKCCPIFCVCCIDDINFHVFDARSQNKLESRIYKKWSGWARECCTRADLLICEVPGMDVKEKALFLCTTFMLDVMVFETMDSGGAGAGS